MTVLEVAESSAVTGLVEALGAAVTALKEALSGTGAAAANVANTRARVVKAVVKCILSLLIVRRWGL